MKHRRLADRVINQRSLFNALFDDEPSLLHCVSCFQAAFALPKGSLKRLGYGNRKSGYGGDTPCAVARCAKGWGSLKMFFRRCCVMV